MVSGKAWTKDNPCCDSEECADYKARSMKKNPQCLIYRRNYDRRRYTQNKIKILEYLGNKCRDCNAEYSPLVKVPTRTKDKTLVPAICLDVEHVRWDKKQHDINAIIKNNFERVIKPELDNCECVLLCKYCHAISTNQLNQNKNYRAKKIEVHKKTWSNGTHKAPKALNSTSA